MTILLNTLLYTVLFIILLILVIAFVVWFCEKMKSESEFIFYVFVGPIILIFALAFLLVSGGSIPMIFGG